MGKSGVFPRGGSSVGHAAGRPGWAGALGTPSQRRACSRRHRPGGGSGGDGTPVGTLTRTGLRTQRRHQALRAACGPPLASLAAPSLLQGRRPWATLRGAGRRPDGPKGPISDCGHRAPRGPAARALWGLRATGAARGPGYRHLPRDWAADERGRRPQRPGDRSGASTGRGGATTTEARAWAFTHLLPAQFFGCIQLDPRSFSAQPGDPAQQITEPPLARSATSG